MATLAPRVVAIRDEADRVSWNRRRSSDGGYVDKPGDHNVGVRGLVHAYDLGQSMPGTPYWEPKFSEFDVWAWQRKIAAQYVAAGVAERARRWPWLFDGGYMHGYDAARQVDIIFTPTVSLTWRVDNNPPREHFQHGHFSIAHTVRAEQDTQPIFTTTEDDDDMTPQEREAFRAEIKSDTVAVVRKVLAEELPAFRAQIKSDTVAVVRKVVAEELAKQ